MVYLEGLANERAGECGCVRLCFVSYKAFFSLGLQLVLICWVGLGCLCVCGFACERVCFVCCVGLRGI